MKIEQRSNPRTGRIIDVMIRFKPIGLLRGRSRNMSLDGMFVETGQIILPKNATVELIFTLPEARLHAHQIYARVMHTSREGAGLAFLNAKISAIKALHGMLNAA